MNSKKVSKEVDRKKALDSKTNAQAVKQMNKRTNVAKIAITTMAVIKTTLTLNFFSILKINVYQIQLPKKMKKKLRMAGNMGEIS